MVTLSQENLDLIRDSINTVSDTINESIEEIKQSPENKEEAREKVKEANMVDKTKSSLTSAEKKRFTSIAKIFIDSWMKSIEKIQKVQEKRNALAIKKESKEPGWLKRWLTRKPKKEIKKEDKCKEGMAWWKKLLLLFTVLGGIYYLFKDKIKEILPILWDKIKALGGWILNLAGEAIVGIWNWIKEICSGLWDWIKEKLPFDKIGEYISAGWDKFTGFFGAIWDWIKKAFQGFIDAILNLPSKIFGWISDAVKWILDPICDALVAAWDWIKGIVLKFWNWITDSLSKVWEGIKGVWEGIVNFYSGIWDYLKQCFSWERIKGVFMQIWDTLKSLFSEEGRKKLLNAIGGFWNNIADWWNSKSWLPGHLKRMDGSTSGVTKEDDLDKLKKEHEDKKKTEVKKAEKKEAPKVEAKVNKVVEQKEIKLKDNVLETIKEVCERLNVFFSAKSGGFIDLSQRAIEEFTKGFKQMNSAVAGISLKNVNEVTNKIDYDDRYNYDYSDRSSRAISHDDRKYNTQNYNVSYNTINVPALNRAIEILNNKTSEEITLLRSQNDYLGKMIDNFDGLGEKITWLDPDKFIQQASNTIIPIVTNNAPKGEYDAAMVKSVQSSLARAFN